MKTILLVEDDPNFLKVVGHMLRKNGYQVMSCSSGELALDLLKSNEFQVVISDFKMGKVSGLRVAKTALSKNPPIPVFMLTAYADSLMAAYDEGFWGKIWDSIPNKVFSKPVNESNLIAAIKNLE